MQESSNNALPPLAGELPAPNAGAGDGAVNGADSQELQELQQELGKWQERVPKLAAALRERTQQAEKLQAELDQLRTTTNPVAAEGHSVDIRGREQLINELEARLKALNAKHQDLQGQLHSRDMEISDLRQDVAAWKDKWQAVTNSLDEQATLAATRERDLQNLKGEFGELNAALEAHTRTIEERDHELATLREESASLNERNAKLFETTELANRQIASLGENLGQLREQLRAQDGGVKDDSRGEPETLRARLAAYDDEMRNRDADLDALRARLESKTEEINALKARHAGYDELVAERAALQQELGRLQEEGGNRGQDLEALHRRIEFMQEEANGLKSKLVDAEKGLAELDALRESEARLQASLAERADEIDRLMDRMAALDAMREEHESRQQLLQGKEDEVARLTAAIDELHGQARVLEERVVEEHAEVERLEQCITTAEQVTGERDEERRQLSAQLAELKARNEHLEAQLHERSNLVMGLEQEKSTVDKSARELHEENDRLGQALAKAERHASEHAEHITQLNSRLERQKEHMVKLEEELAEAQEEYASVKKDRAKALAERDRQISELSEQLADSKTLATESDPAVEGAHEELVANMRANMQKLEDKLEEQIRLRTQAAEQAEGAMRELESKLAAAEAAGGPGSEGAESDAVELLQEEVHKLEKMVRDRTEQLNKIQWQQNMTERVEAANMDSDNKMLIVLNQQLTDARESNNRLVEKIRALEAQLADSSVAADQRFDAGDDLTAIKGIGPKVASQLVDLGIQSYAQIAQLDNEDLASAAHVLHAFKNRIEKDEWVEQARVLVKG